MMAMQQAMMKQGYEGVTEADGKFVLAPAPR